MEKKKVKTWVWVMIILGITVITPGTIIFFFWGGPAWLEAHNDNVFLKIGGTISFIGLMLFIGFIRIFPRIQADKRMKKLEEENRELKKLFIDKK